MPSNQADPRHPLLLYQRLYSLWRAPALLLALLAGGLAWLAPGPLASLQARAGFAALAVLAAFIYLFALAGPRLAYVQCRRDHLLLSTPLFRLAISYSRIRTTRPVPFHPGSVRWSDGHVVDPYLGQTVLALDLLRYPVARRWLRLWLLPYLLPSDFVGLLLLVPDWMALSLEIEGRRAEWKTRRSEQGRENTLTSLTMRRRF